MYGYTIAVMPLQVYLGTPTYPLALHLPGWWQQGCGSKGSAPWGTCGAPAAHSPVGPILQPTPPPTHGLPRAQTPYHRRSAAGVLAFRQLLAGVMLRRTKASVAHQLALPPCVHEDVAVRLSVAERALYAQLLRRYNAGWSTLKEAVRAVSGFAKLWVALTSVG